MPRKKLMEPEEVEQAVSPEQTGLVEENGDAAVGSDESSARDSAAGNAAEEPAAGAALEGEPPPSAETEVVDVGLTLAACGKEDAPSDPDHIVIGDYELQYKGASIMTDSEGKDAVVLTMDFTNNGKDAADYLWSIYEKAMQDGIELEGAIVYVSEDSFKMVSDSQFTEIAPGKTIEVRSAYTLRDAENPVEVTFTDLLEKYEETITIDPTTLTREGAKPERSAAETDEPMTAAPTGDTLLDWWNGDWYGWWIITGADGGYEGSNNNWWDCCANISIGADYTGNVIIWDEDLPKDNAISAAAVNLSSAGTGEYGTLTSESGYFMDGELAHADWVVDPGLMDYDNLICIDGWYEDENGSYHYSIRF